MDDDNKDFSIDVPPAEVERIREKAIRAKIKDDMAQDIKDKIILKVDESIQKCLVGWRTAPKTFEARVRAKLGLSKDWKPWNSYVTEEHRKLISQKLKDAWNRRNGVSVPVTNDNTQAVESAETELPSVMNESQEEEEWVSDGGAIVTERDLLGDLDKKEREFFKKRLDEYKREFDLNTSSDHSLILQVVAEEIRQRRLIRESLVVGGHNRDKELSSSVKRMTDALTTLGITRSQRQEANTEIDGNVAQLADQLDKKLDKIAKENQLFAEEEEDYMRQKMTRTGPKNMIPSIKEIRDIEREFGLTE